MNIISNLLSLVHSTTIDKHSFMKSFDSLSFGRDQQEFLHNFAKQHPLKESEKLLDELLDPKTSTVREQRIGVQLAVAYKDHDRIFKVLSTEAVIETYSSTVLMVACKYSAMVLTEAQLLKLLFPETEELHHLAPAYITAIVHSIACYNTKMINRDLVLKLYQKYGECLALIVIGSMEEKSPDVVANLLWKDMKLKYLTFYGSLVRRHPEAVLKYVEYIMEERKCDKIKSYTDEIHPAMVITTKREYSLMMQRLITVDQKTCKMVIEWFRKWFVDTAEKHNVRPLVPPFVLQRVNELMICKDEYISLLKDMDVFSEYNCPKLLHLPFQRLTVDELMRIFELFADKHISSPTSSSTSKSFLSTFFLRMPHHTSSQLARTYMFQEKAFQKYSTKLVDWLVANMDIEQVPILCPKLGEEVAERLYEVALQTDGPALNRFEMRVKYVKFLSAYYEDQEKMKEFVDHLSPRDPMLRAEMLAAFFFGSLYLKKSIDKVLDIIIRELTTERQDVVERFWSHFITSEYGHGHKTIRVELLHNLDLLENKQHAAKFEQLILSNIKVLSDVTCVSPLLFHLVDKTAVGVEQAKPMTNYTFEIAKKIDPEMAFKLMTKAGLMRANYSRVKFDINQLTDLFHDHMNRKILQGDYDEFSQLVRLAFMKHRSKMIECKKLQQLYHVFLQTVMAGRTRIVDYRMHEYPAAFVLLEFMPHIVESKRRNELVYDLIQADPSLILVPSIQRVLLSTRGDFRVLDKFLSLDDKGLMSYESLQKLHPKGPMILVKPHHRVVTFNPMILKEQRSNEFLPPKLREKFGKMLVYGATEIMRGNVSRDTINPFSFMDVNRWWRRRNISATMGAKKMLHILPTMYIEKNERDIMLKLLDETILSNKTTDEYPRVVSSVTHLALARLARIRSPYHPEEHWKWLFDNIRPEYGMFFYSAVIRMSHYTRRQELVSKYLDELEKRQDYDEHWDSNLHKLLVSWMKIDFRRHNIGSDTEKKLLDKAIHLFNDKKVHREVRTKAIEVLITYVITSRDPTNKLLSSIWPIIERSIEEEQVEDIPKAIVRGLVDMYQNKKLHMKMVTLMMKLLDSKSLVIQEMVWRTLKKVFYRICIPMDLLPHLVDKSVERIIDFNHDIGHKVACDAMHLLFMMSKHEESILEVVLDDVFKRLLTDKKFKDLDETKYNAELEWDRPVQGRIMILINKLSRYINREVSTENTELVHEIETSLVEPLVKMLISEDPFIYFTRGFRLRFSLADWRDATSVREALTEFVADLVDNVHDEKERMVWVQTAIDHFIGVLFMEGTVNEAVLLDVVSTLSRRQTTEPKRDVLDPFLALILHFAGHGLEWQPEESRKLLKQFRAKKSNLVLQICARKLMFGSGRGYSKHHHHHCHHKCHHRHHHHCHHHHHRHHRHHRHHHM